MPALDMSSGNTANTYQGATAGGLDLPRTLPPLTALVAGTALNTSTTPTSILPAAAKAVLPPGYFVVGKALRIVATGIASCIVTTPGTLTLDVRLGNVVAWNGGAMNLNVVAKTNVAFRLEVLLTCRAVGSGTSANLIGVGTLHSEAVVGAASGTGLPALLPASAPAVGTGFDSTISQTVDLFATFSISNAGNAIQVLEYTIEPVN